MTKKEQLYYLLEAFLKGEYDVKSFCEVYEDIFYRDFPTNELTEVELHSFEWLGRSVSRFSTFEDDIKLYPNIYSTETDIKKLAKEVYLRLVHDTDV